jgi:hypothetical protein
LRCYGCSQVLWYCLNRGEPTILFDKELSGFPLPIPEIQNIEGGGLVETYHFYKSPAFFSLIKIVF